MLDSIRGQQSAPGPPATETEMGGPLEKLRFGIVRLHDLRHSFASVGAGASLGRPIMGKLLGHTLPATTARYSHLDADPMRCAADIMGSQLRWLVKALT
jgi:integrase